MLNMYVMLSETFLVVQELQEMLEKHRAQNEAWLRARAEENDKERKELCKLRVRRD